MIEIKGAISGIVGYLHEIECKETKSMLVFQLPRTTNMLSDVYVKGALATLEKSLPPGRTAMVIGCDVNIYELGEADSIVLKLKGLV
jgi:hypothetical protein